MRYLFLFLTLSLLGCNVLNEESLQVEGEFDPILMEAEPYLLPIETSNLEFRKKAASIVDNCLSADETCYVHEIYRYVVDNYKYYGDPRRDELVQTPNQTLSIGGGDCEDLTILLNSLLENIGVETYLVLTENHAYSLACGVDVDRLGELIIPSLTEEDIFADETISLPAYSGRYYGSDGGDLDYPVEINYDVQSSTPIGVLVVPNPESLERAARGKSYSYYPECSNQDVLRTTGSCQVDVAGGVLLLNNENEDATIDIYMTINYLAVNVSTILTNYYSIKNESCVVLDATAGKYGYPGYDGNLIGEKIAISPTTREYFNLTN
jgi:hypothetical protein